MFNEIFRKLRTRLGEGGEHKPRKKGPLVSLAIMLPLTGEQEVRWTQYTWKSCGPPVEKIWLDLLDKTKSLLCKSPSSIHKA